MWTARDLSPLLSLAPQGACWMVGLVGFGKASPSSKESSFALSRCMPDGACRSLQRVCRAGVAVQKPRSQVRPALHPVAAKSLSVALWKVPAVAPGHGVPAGNQSAVRVTSPIEAVPRRKVDVQNTMQSVRGFGIITRNGAIRRLPAFRTVSLPESRIPARVCGFRLSRATRERKLRRDHTPPQGALQLGERLAHQNQLPMT